MKPFEPVIEKLAPRVVLTATTVGDPRKVTAQAMKPLYGTAYGTRFKVFKPERVNMEVGPLSAYWPDAHRKPRSRWTAIWNLEVSAFVHKRDLVQKDPGHPVELRRLPSATIARVLHVGTYASEKRTIEKLHAFVTAHGYRLAGPHEEVYLTRPGPKAKTIIQYAVKRRR